jgi:hypothetical protein
MSAITTFLSSVSTADVLYTVDNSVIHGRQQSNNWPYPVTWESTTYPSGSEMSSFNYSLTAPTTYSRIGLSGNQTYFKVYSDIDSGWYYDETWNATINITLTFTTDTIIRVSRTWSTSNNNFNYSVGTHFMQAFQPYVFSGTMYYSNDYGDGQIYVDFDSDADGLFDNEDNCPEIYNPNQEDCNNNGIGDVCDIADITSNDCNENSIPDECEADCDNDGFPDECDIAGGFDTDCDNNGIPDGCELRQDQELLANDLSHEDQFGGSVSLSGDVAIVGASWHDDNGIDSGAAYIYRLIYVGYGMQWVEEQKLLASDGGANDNYGFSVSVFSDTAIVGSLNTGAAYIYRFDGTTWNEEALLSGTVSEFGRSVSIDQDVAIVGSSGDATVYRYDGSSWNVEATLIATDWWYPGNSFGISVSISGNRVIIGANGDYVNGTASGSAYIFSFDGTSWSEEAKLYSSNIDGYDSFGYAVSIDGDAAVVGAYMGDGINTDTGAAYAFRHDGTAWVEEAVLAPSDGLAYGWGGYSVSISGNNAAVGTIFDDDSGAASGSIWIFQYDGIDWSETVKLFALDTPTEGGGTFGNAVEIDGTNVIGGALTHNHKGVGTGSAYVFRNIYSDCNGNGISDECDILDGTSIDLDENGVPDECEVNCFNFAGGECTASDFDNNGEVNIADLLQLIAAWGNSTGVEDLDNDGDVDVADLLILIGDWGPVE